MQLVSIWYIDVFWYKCNVCIFRTKTTSASPWLSNHWQCHWWRSFSSLAFSFCLTSFSQYYSYYLATQTHIPHVCPFLITGLEPGITELAGEAGTGKTQFALQMMIEVSFSLIYIRLILCFFLQSIWYFVLFLKTFLL